MQKARTVLTAGRDNASTEFGIREVARGKGAYTRVLIVVVIYMY